MAGFLSVCFSPQGLTKSLLPQADIHMGVRKQNPVGSCGPSDGLLGLPETLRRILYVWIKSGRQRNFRVPSSG